VLAALSLSVSGRGAAHRMDQSFSDMVARADSGLVRIQAKGCGRALFGTGFLIDSRHVATAAHVVDGATRIDFQQRGRTVAAGTIVGSDPARDIALVRTDRPVRGHALSLSNRPPRIAEDVAALGFPLGRPLAVARGFVRGTAQTVPAAGSASQQLIQTDASVQHGNSGGPLLAVSDGTVLGMVNLSSASGGGLSFAVSALAVGPLLERWRSDPEAVPQKPCRADDWPPVGI
jgi:S1-C subfamily serine protease